MSNHVHRDPKHTYLPNVQDRGEMNDHRCSCGLTGTFDVLVKHMADTRENARILADINRKRPEEKWIP